jgi:nucleoside-diphosphate-sugar epimerase
VHVIANHPVSPLAADLDHILAHTEGLWEPLRGRSLFVTGGTGFFGRWLLESFAEANRRLKLEAQAVVLSRQPEAFRARAGALAADGSIRLVPGNVRTLNAAEIRDQLGSAAPKSFAFVLHAASETGVPANRNNPAAVLETLFEGTRRVLDFAVRHGARHFLLTSSGAVYGEQPPGLSHVPESYSGAPQLSSPLSAYGEGKRIAELLCNIYSRAYGLDCRIARCFAFVGPGLPLDAHYAIGNFLRDALAGEPIRVKGDGTPIRSYLYAADLAIWLWTLLLHPQAAGIYNVGSDEAQSILDIAECVARLSPRQPPVTVAQRPEPARPAARYVPDISRARRELGLEVEIPFEDAVRRTIGFHQPTQRMSYEK